MRYYRALKLVRSAYPYRSSRLHAIAIRSALSRKKRAGAVADSSKGQVWKLERSTGSSCKKHRHLPVLPLHLNALANLERRDNYKDQATERCAAQTLTECSLTSWETLWSGTRSIVFQRARNVIHTYLGQHFNHVIEANLAERRDFGFSGSKT